MRGGVIEQNPDQLIHQIAVRDHRVVAAGAPGLEPLADDGAAGVVRRLHTLEQMGAPRLFAGVALGKGVENLAEMPPVDDLTRLVDGVHVLPDFKALLAGLVVGDVDDAFFWRARNRRRTLFDGRCRAG
jgi:hypothetical protein